MKNYKPNVVSLGVFFLLSWVCSCVALADEEGVASKLIAVDLDRQKLYAWENDELIHEFHAVTGRCGKETEPGRYEIAWKSEDYVSKTYGSPMPYSMFFSKDGKAIHGTYVATLRSFIYVYITESVGSHGCVGLSKGNAGLMFEWAPTGTSILVMDEAPEDGWVPSDLGWKSMALHPSSGT